MKPERSALKIRNLATGEVGWVSTWAFLTTRESTSSWPIIFSEKARAMMKGNGEGRYDSATDGVLMHNHDYEILEED